MGFTNAGREAFIAQGISKLTACDAPELFNLFDQREHWVNNFIFNSIFRAEIKEDLKPFIFSILRRAQMSIAEYEDGRVSLIDYIDGDRDRWSVYFRALYHFELSVMLMCQAYEAIRKLAGNVNYYDHGDGSAAERLFAIYNISKHLEPTSLAKGQLHSVWLTNDGIATSRAELTWDELAESLRTLGSMANEISDPVSLKQNLQKPAD